jgi:GAF domain-containing protein
VTLPHDMTGLGGKPHQVRDFMRRYAVAFETFLGKRGEATLRVAYELGREAIARELGVLEVAAVHHEALGQALRRQSHLEPGVVVALGGDFLTETLSAFEMVQRGFREERERALLEQRHARILRQLSTLLSDVALTAGAGSFSEVLQLVAEQARELTAADRCIARTRAAESGTWMEATAHAEDIDTWSEANVPPKVAGASAGHRLSVPILTLGGSEIGEVEVSKTTSLFSELDEAILVHVAQMTAAAVERARLYHRR